MRPITKKVVVVLVAILVFLVALGALPSLLRSGDPYYVTAEPTDRTLADENATMVDAANLTERTYRYTWEALENASGEGIDTGSSEVNGTSQGDNTVSDEVNGTTSGDGVASGRSSPYWKGPFGFKEVFTHSPFDEMDALQTRYSATMIGEREALVRWENQTYRLAVTGG